MRAEVKCAFLLVAGAGASVADSVASGARARDIFDPKLTAEFGDRAGDRKTQPMGTVEFRIGGKPGYQAVNWTTSEITIPRELVRDVCGSLPSKPTFTYSVNEKWGHGEGRRSGQGPSECGAPFTGGHWDPTAACSSESGNGACKVCGTAGGYKCDAESFSPVPDAKGSGAYRFLNENACELGDLSGMHGELKARGSSCGADQSPKCQEWAESGECQRRPEYLSLLCPMACGACADEDYMTLGSIAGDDAGLAQMSAPFGVVSRESVTSEPIGINCDASGPPPVHATDCDCLRYNGERSPSVGTLTVFHPWDHETFYLAGAGLDALKGRSVVVKCGSAFGDSSGKALFCAALL